LCALWKKPPKETEKTHRWGRLTIQEGGGLLTGGGPVSWEVVVWWVEFPFRLVFVLLRLVVRTLGFLLRSASRALSRRPMPWESASFW